MPDLFSRQDEVDAAKRAAAAEAERVAAQQRARLAPHGEVVIRRARLAEATRAALEAEIELDRIRRDQRS